MRDCISNATELREILFDYLDACETIEELSKLDGEINVGMEFVDDQIKEVKEQINELEDHLRELRSSKAVYANIDLIMQQMAVYRFVRKEYEWRKGGKWREWHE